MFKFICAGIKNIQVVRNASFINQICAGVVFRGAASNHEKKSIIKFAVAFQAFCVCSVSIFLFSISAILYTFGFEDCHFRVFICLNSKALRYFFNFTHFIFFI